MCVCVFGSGIVCRRKNQNILWLFLPLTLWRFISQTKVIHTTQHPHPLLVHHDWNETAKERAEANKSTEIHSECNSARMLLLLIRMTAMLVLLIAKYLVCPKNRNIKSYIYYAACTPTDHNIQFVCEHTHSVCRRMNQMFTFCVHIYCDGRCKCAKDRKYPRNFVCFHWVDADV